MALAAYRHLLRSTRIAFQGDSFRLMSARHAARDGFEQNRSLSPSSSDASNAVSHAEEVAKILRENVVQGQAMQEAGDEQYYSTEGPYTASWRIRIADHGAELRIHEHTERGDNESIKKAGKTAGRRATNLAGKCASL
ncbi:Mitochondrial zinc maintenance protein 1, mitochondrial [Coniosporium tulheliwenetii]|uniref:Mitochondrial zinc maintenance protein 1, mitochondrial n=1 Tax=Coniosporium tulheliwenetii TaxID=3383036 RepID=A0ACC2ZQL1_9PEZI|nr:Mitochondrial zinc maintenance protein 1, mitochondrial [Cladosporium sp. JES 115]